jgi:hypothetical protein
MGCEESRTGLDGGRELLGAMDDCLRGEDPRFVFLGDRDRGGGRFVRLLRKIWWDVMRSGMEPVASVSTSSCDHSNNYALFCISIDPDPVASSPRLGGDLSGDEKIPETGSRPCSSYMPLSSSVMPVFLRNVKKCLRACPGALLCLPSLHTNVVVIVFARFAFLSRRHVIRNCLQGVNARGVVGDASVLSRLNSEGAVDKLFGFRRDVNGKRTRGKVQGLGVSRLTSHRSEDVVHKLTATLS